MTTRGTWQDALDAQMGIWRWQRTKLGDRWLAAHYALNANGLADGTRLLLGSIYTLEDAKLTSADPFYVSGEMTELVDHARRDFKPEPLIEQDLMTDTGFVFFAKPLDVSDRYGAHTNVAAFSWAPIIVATEKGADRITNADMHELAAKQVETFDDSAADPGTPIAGIGLTLYCTTKIDGWDERSMGPPPELIPFHLTPWWYGMSFDGNEVDETGKPTGAGEWWRIVQATLRLSQQQIATRDELRPDRAERRRNARLGFHERDVVVVRLRREAGAPHDDHVPGEANYSHRFIVSGHWRNQWYPASGVHRQIFIAPFVKGDESLPLVIRDRRVFTWHR